MRRRAYASWACGAVGVAAAVYLAGCVFRTSIDCENALVDCGTGGATSSSSSSGGGGGTAGTGGMPINCIPSAVPVDDSCGVFVQANAAGAIEDGTQAHPYKTLQKAVDNAAKKRVYACAGTFTESVTIAAPLALYGKLDCKSWAYNATTTTTLTAQADAVPLTLSTGADPVTVEGFAITAADAAKDGGSSIAVIADQGSASFVRCDLVAGAGKAGLAGTTPTDSVGPIDSSDVGIKGNDGKNACMDPAAQFGGLTKQNALCSSVGGQGGNGLTTNGSSGDLQPSATAQTALGGVGQPNMDPLWSCVVGQGAIGASGTAGVSGTGAAGASSLGTVDKSGYTGTPGQPGGLASPGQGGGGGGGAKGKLLCAGASGGGGGAGGCGGKGGLGGNAGGASIAILSLGATLSFDKVTIKAGVGGDGGSGGDGQGGGVGGKGGTGGNGDSTAPATLAACDGGKGGQGGTGGKGGGGRGGHAIGIAYTGATMPSTKGATFAKGTTGKGGLGAADMMHDGDAGAQADVQVFQ